MTNNNTTARKNAKNASNASRIARAAPSPTPGPSTSVAFSSFTTITVATATAVTVATTVASSSTPVASSSSVVAASSSLVASSSASTTVPSSSTAHATQIASSSSTATPTPAAASPAKRGTKRKGEPLEDEQGEAKKPRISERLQTKRIRDEERIAAEEEAAEAAIEVEPSRPEASTSKGKGKGKREIARPENPLPERAVDASPKAKKITIRIPPSAHAKGPKILHFPDVIDMLGGNEASHAAFMKIVRRRLDASNRVLKKTGRYPQSTLVDLGQFIGKAKGVSVKIKRELARMVLAWDDTCSLCYEAETEEEEEEEEEKEEEKEKEEDDEEDVENPLLAAVTTMAARELAEGDRQPLPLSKPLNALATGSGLSLLAAVAANELPPLPPRSWYPRPDSSASDRSLDGSCCPRCE